MAEQEKDQRKVEVNDGVIAVEYSGGLKMRTNAASVEEAEKRILDAIDAEAAKLGITRLQPPTHPKS